MAGRRLTWGEVRDMVYVNERKYVTAVWCEDESAPDTYNGKHSDAPVYRGPAAYRLHTGEIVSL